MHTNHSITEKQKNLLPLFLSLFCYGIIFTLLSEILLATVAMEAGLLLIISALVSFLPVGIYLGRTPWRANLSASHAPLPIRTFLFFLSLDITLNLLISQAPTLLEPLLNIFHLSAENKGSDAPLSITFCVYVCLLGPILEELIYRGALMQTLKKYGTVFAIVFSAFCFAIMHHDFYQGLSAFTGGLVYGYVASKYNFRTGVILHIINNTFSILMSLLMDQGTGGSVLLLLIIAAAAIISVVGAVKYVLAARRNASVPAQTEPADAIDAINEAPSFSPIQVWKHPMVWVVLLYDSIYLILLSFHWLHH